MLINLLHRPQTPRLSTYTLLIFSFFAGLFFFRTILNQHISSPFIHTKAPDYYALADQKFSAMFYNTDPLTVLLDSQTIDPILKKRLSKHPTKFFPKKFYVTTSDSFEPGTSFPDFDYHSSIVYDTFDSSSLKNTSVTFQIYGITLNSLEQLSLLSRMDGIKKIEEWHTIKTFRSGPHLTPDPTD